MSIKLVRLDFRLIHGQVVTKWVKAVDATKIVIINDTLANDEFMANIYKMAAPSNVKVEIYSIQAGISAFKENQFGEQNTILLFKSVEEVYLANKEGLIIDALQIGGLGGGAGRVNTSTGISFDAKDVKLLREMKEFGSEIYIQVVPSQSRYDFEKVIEKYNFN
ncbi:MAG: PTS sugar transporter subunit IIB [Erysipelotrichaceae bacterium]